MYHRSVSNMRLLRRGWALQKRLLAPRTLHFTSTQLFWVSRHKLACELFPERLPTAIAYELSYFKKQLFSRPMWRWFVERYSTFDLTYTKDNLVAISELARSIQRQTGDQYIAGMWRKDPDFQLCRYSSIGRDVQRVVHISAPACSWAFLDRLVDASLAEKFNYTSESTRLWISDIEHSSPILWARSFGVTDSGKALLKFLMCVTCRFPAWRRGYVLDCWESYIKAIVNFDCPWSEREHNAWGFFNAHIWEFFCDNNNRVIFGAYKTRTSSV
jgi:hypothetical protein